MRRVALRVVAGILGVLCLLAGCGTIQPPASLAGEVQRLDLQVRVMSAADAIRHLPNARVQVTPDPPTAGGSSGSCSPYLEGTTDHQGWVTLSDLCPGSIRVTVTPDSRDGFYPSTITLGHLDQDAASLVVRVVPVGTTVMRMTVSPPSASLAVGETRQFRATADSVPDLDLIASWASSDARVGTIDASGIFTARSDGTCHVTASLGDGPNASAEVSVLPEGDF